MEKHLKTTDHRTRRRFRAAVVATLVTAAALASATVPAEAGWLGRQTYTVAAGMKSLQWGYACPDGQIAASGAFAFNAVGQEDTVSLTFNGPRNDEETPDLKSWGWHFWWPRGAKPGETITFDLYCAGS